MVQHNIPGPTKLLAESWVVSRMDSEETFLNRTAIHRNSAETNVNLASMHVNIPQAHEDPAKKQ